MFKLEHGLSKHIVEFLKTLDIDISYDGQNVFIQDINTKEILHYQSQYQEGPSDDKFNVFVFGNSNLQVKLFDTFPAVNATVTRENIEYSIHYIRKAEHKKFCKYDDAFSVWFQIKNSKNVGNDNAKLNIIIDYLENENWYENGIAKTTMWYDALVSGRGVEGSGTFLSKFDYNEWNGNELFKKTENTKEGYFDILKFCVDTVKNRARKCSFHDENLMNELFHAQEKLNPYILDLADMIVSTSVRHNKEFIDDLTKFSTQEIHKCDEIICMIAEKAAEDTKKAIKQRTKNVEEIRGAIQRLSDMRPISMAFDIEQINNTEGKAKPKSM